MSYLSVTNEVLSASSAAMHQPENPLVEGEISHLENYFSSLWSKWPVGACALSTLIETVSAAAAAVFGDLPLSIARGACALVLGLLTFQVYNTIHLQNLEHCFARLAERIQQLTARVLALSEENRALHETETDLRRQIEGVREESRRSSEESTAKLETASARALALSEENKALHVTETELRGQIEGVREESRRSSEESTAKLKTASEQLDRRETNLVQMDTILSRTKEFMSLMNVVTRSFVENFLSGAIPTEQLKAHLEKLQEIEGKFFKIADIQRQGPVPFEKQAADISQKMSDLFLTLTLLMKTSKEKEVTRPSTPPSSPATSRVLSSPLNLGSLLQQLESNKEILTREIVTSNQEGQAPSHPPVPTHPPETL